MDQRLLQDTKPHILVESEDAVVHNTYRGRLDLKIRGTVWFTGPVTEDREMPSLNYLSQKSGKLNR